MKYKKATEGGIGVLVGVILIVILGFILAAIVPAIAKEKNALCLYFGVACTAYAGEKEDQKEEEKISTFDCNKFGEATCMAYNDKCYPTYEEGGKKFDECKECPESNFDCREIGSPCRHDSCKEACERDHCNTDCTYVLTNNYINPRLECYNEKNAEEYEKQLTFEECVNKEFYPRFYKSEFALCRKCPSSFEKCSDLKQTGNFQIPETEFEIACEADICDHDCEYLDFECYEVISYSENCDDDSGNIIDKGECKTKLESLPSKFNWEPKTIVDLTITIEGITWEYWGNDAGRNTGQHYWMRDDFTPNKQCPGDLIFDSSGNMFRCSTDPDLVSSNFFDAKLTNYIKSTFLGFN